MKTLKLISISGFLSLFLLAGLNSCKKEVLTQNESVTENDFQTRISAEAAEAIRIRRKFKWKVTFGDGSACRGGKGLCISGITENQEDGYEGKLMRNSYNSNQVVFFLSESLVRDEDEIIQNGFLNIDENFEIERNMAILIGFTDAVTVKAGSYQIRSSINGLHPVVVDLE